MPHKFNRAWRRAQNERVRTRDRLRKLIFEAHANLPPQSASAKHWQPMTRPAAEKHWCPKNWKQMYLRHRKLHRARQLGLIWPYREWRRLLADIDDEDGQR